MISVRIFTGKRGWVAVAMLLLCVLSGSWAGADSGTQGSREQGVELCNIAFAQWEQGDVQGAYEKYKNAEEIFRVRAKENPTDAQAQRDLSVLNERLADVYVSMNKGVQALLAYRRSLEIDEKLFMNDGGDLWLLHHMSIVNLKLGDLFVWLAKAEKAAEAYERSLAFCQKIFDRSSENMEARLNVCLVRYRQGQLLQRLKLPDQAAKARQMEMAAREAVLSGGSPKAMEGVFFAYKHLGEQYRMVGQWVDSVAAFQESLEPVGRLCQDYPENIQYQWELSSVYRNLGIVHAQLGEWDTALSAYQQVLSLSEQMAKADPDNRQIHQRDILVTHYKLGKILEGKGVKEAALHEYKTALALAETLTSDGAGDGLPQQDADDIRKEIDRLER